MYEACGIKKLSPTQISKLLKGLPVRVSHGSHHHVKLSPEQHKKVMSAARKGKGTTIRFDPYQQQDPHHIQHFGRRSLGEGEGFWGDVAKEVAPIAIDIGSQYLKNRVAGHGIRAAKPRGRPRGRGLWQDLAPARREIVRELAPIVKHYAPKAIDYGAAYAKRRLAGGALLPAGYGDGIHHKHLPGRHHQHLAHQHKGKGFWGDVAREVAPIAIDLGSQYLKKRVGSGAKGGRPAGRRRGKGLGDDILSGVETAAPYLLDAAPFLL